MNTFKTYLIEKVENLFLPDIDKRRKYVDDVWDILQKSYSSIGGIRGSGFNDKEDMINNIPFWKVLKKSGKVVAVLMYKDKMGRKGVAMGTMPEGKALLAREYINDIKLNRSYKEISKAALKFMVNLIGYDTLIKSAHKPTDAQKYIDDEKLIYPVDGSDPEVKNHPQLKDYFYQRTIGGKLTTKIMVGTPGNIITTGKDVLPV